MIHLQDDGAWPGSLIPRGSTDWELLLPVAEGDRVVTKPRDDGFDGTDLEAILRGAGVSRLCVVGIQSEMCVAATARGAMARGLTVLLPRDGHTTYAVPADGAALAVPAAHVSRVAEWSLGDRVVAPEPAGRRPVHVGERRRVTRGTISSPERWLSSRVTDVERASTDRPWRGRRVMRPGPGFEVCEAGRWSSVVALSGGQ